MPSMVGLFTSTMTWFKCNRRARVLRWSPFVPAGWAARSAMCLALLSACGRERVALRTKNIMPSISATQAPTAQSPTSPRAAEDASEAPESSPRSPAFHERVGEREAMVRLLVAEGIHDEAVLRALQRVPRHAFVPPAFRSAAYANHPLPIGSGQTISQPEIVAFMTEAVKPTPQSNCLEIGTGSGYQAAVLAEICRRVFSIEYLPEVARFGGQNLRALGYGPNRVALRVGDGYRGWPEAAPFDVIVVTAAPESVPAPLLDQLSTGGRLVIPVGPARDVQRLERWTRLREGKEHAAFRRESLLTVQFVPFAGKLAPH